MRTIIKNRHEIDSN